MLFTRNTAVIITTLASSVLATTSSATNNEASDVKAEFSMEANGDTSGSSGTKGSTCDKFTLTATASDTSATYYGGVAYASSLTDGFSVMTDGKALTLKSGNVTYEGNFKTLQTKYTNVTVPTGDIYEFGFITESVALGVESTLKGTKLESFGQSVDITGGKVFLSVSKFPPTEDDLKAGEMYKSTTQCTVSEGNGEGTAGSTSSTISTSEGSGSISTSAGNANTTG